MKKITIGMDLGDKKHEIFVLGEDGKKVESKSVENTKNRIEQFFKPYETEETTVILETGTHSPWISLFLKEHGFRVAVVNSRQLPLITKSLQKNDANDAEKLARLGRADFSLLKTIEHRSKESQEELVSIKARNQLVQVRTGLINQVRGLLKSSGVKLPSCSTPAFEKKQRPLIPKTLQEAIFPLLDTLEFLNQKIKAYDSSLEKMVVEKHPETKMLTPVNGVGTLTALTFILTLDKPERFKKSRDVGAFLGLTPRQSQSGDSQKQLRITKAGNTYLRCLLITSAHYILGPFGKPSDLRSFGEKMMKRGGKNAKKRAIVAVARKLAVLLHRLWKTKEIYRPFHKEAPKETPKPI